MGLRIFEEKKLVLLACVMLASPVAAFECSFARECVEGDVCQDSGYEVSVQRQTAEAANAQVSGMSLAVSMAQITDPTGDFLALTLDDTDALKAWAWVSEFGSSLLTVGADGAARYTAHVPEGETSILYIGRCEE